MPDEVEFAYEAQNILTFPLWHVLHQVAHRWKSKIMYECQKIF